MCARQEASSRRLLKVLWLDTGFPVSVEERGKSYHLEAAGARLPLILSTVHGFPRNSCPGLHVSLPSHNQAELPPESPRSHSSLKGA